MSLNLFGSQGATWQDTRTKVNPVLMKPRVVKMYIEAMDKIASEFIQRVNVIRDTKNEMPEDFKNEMNKWALESVAYIALNQRLGLLGPTDKNSKGQQLIEVGAS